MLKESKQTSTSKGRIIIISFVIFMFSFNLILINLTVGVFALFMSIILMSILGTKFPAISKNDSGSDEEYQTQENHLDRTLNFGKDITNVNEWVFY